MLLRQGGGVKTTVSTVKKNNDLELTAVCIMKEDTNIGVNIYVDEYYRKFIDGDMNLEEIVEAVSYMYEKNAPLESKPSFDWVRDFESVKDKIIFRVINSELNAERLTEIPSKQVQDLDLSYVFCINLENLDGLGEGSGTITVRNEMMDWWNVDVDQLMALAQENTKKLGIVVRPLSDILTAAGMSLDDDMDVPFVVASNKAGAYGAGVIFIDGVLDEITDRFGTDAIVIPSSVHECLIVPVSEEMPVFSSMVKEVNATQLAQDEILSDHAYLFEKESGQLRSIDW